MTSFGLIFFSSGESAGGEDRYRLVFETARFADRHGFESVWLPERHFAQAGCLYPSPSVLHAALARETRRVQLRAGSVVLPLNDPVRVAEEWALVDNLSGGRVGVAFASGWHPGDFALRPENYERRHEVMLQGIETVRRLWRGESIRRPGGTGEEVAIRTFPTPIQKELPIWLTAAGNPKTFEAAGRLGANVLTHVLNLGHEQLAENLAIYRAARAESGHDPATGQVSLMLHTFVGASDAQAIETARGPFCDYLDSVKDSLGAIAQSKGKKLDFSRMSSDDVQTYIAFIFERLLESRRVLFGGVASCRELVAEFVAMGVSEIACQLDFGVDTEAVIANLPHLAALADACRGAEFEALVAEAAPTAKPQAVKPQVTTSAVSSTKELPEPLDVIQGRCREVVVDGTPAVSGYVLQRLWRRDGEALGQYTRAAGHDAGFTASPALWDACLGILPAALSAQPSDIDGNPPIMQACRLDGLGRLRCWRAPGAEIWSHAVIRADESKAEISTGEVWLRDASGAPLAHVSDIRLRPPAPSAEPAEQATSPDNRWLYRLAWEAVIAPEKVSDASAARWVIVPDRQGVGRALAAELERRGIDCEIVGCSTGNDRPGGMPSPSAASACQCSPLAPREERQEHRLAERDGYCHADAPSSRRHATRRVNLVEALSRSDGSPVMLLHLAALDLESSSEAATVEDVEAAVEAHLLQVVETVRTASDAVADGAKSPRVRLWLATRGGQRPGGIESGPVEPAQAPTWGLGRTIAVEHSDIWGGLIDLDPITDIDPTDAAAQLLAVITSPSGEDQVAIRDGQRHVPRLVRDDSEDDTPNIKLDPDATYLITGGTGGLGLKVAHWLADRGAKHLVLLGSRPLPVANANGANGAANGNGVGFQRGQAPFRRGSAGKTRGRSGAAKWSQTPLETAFEEAHRRRAAIGELEARGVRVRYFAADVADEARMRAVLEECRRELPPIRGVVHAAGRWDDRPLMDLDAAGLASVLRPKLAGAMLLDRLLTDEPLDFFVLFSSAASLLATPGQGNYAAANAFLDALADARRRNGRPALSVNWGPWSQVGFGASAHGQSAHERLELLGIHRLSPTEGLAALGQVWSKPAHQSAVLRVDWPTLFRAVASSAKTPLLRRLAESVPTATGTVDTPARRELLALPAEERPRWLTEYLGRLVASVLHMPPGQLDTDRPLNQVGLDSLMAVELKNRIEGELGTVPPMVAFLKGPSLAELARQIAGTLESEAAAAPLALSADGGANLENLDLSYPQRALWFLQELAPESAAYNIVFPARIRSEIDADAVRRAFQKLVDRHGSLRTTYSSQDGRPRQTVHVGVPLAFEHVDAAGWDDAALSREVEAAAHVPFDLHRGPLFRVHLYTRSAAEHVLLLAVHHVAIDFWSLVVLLDEFRVLYEAEVSGEPNEPAELPPVPARYTDYVRWQQKLLEGAEGRRLWDYWRTALSGELPTLDLPTDRPRPPVQTFRGAAAEFRVDVGLAAALRTLGRDEGTTLYAVLLTAYQVLLHRYTGQDDLLVGSPVTGRQRAELERVVGCFINPVVLRADLGGNPTFREQLRRTKDVLLAALEHQNFPTPLLLERLQFHRDRSRAPLFETVFVLNRPHQSEHANLASFVSGEAGVRMDLGPLALEPFPFEQHAAMFDLLLMMVELESGLSGSLQYSTDLFEPETMRRMAGHFRAVLRQIALDPDRPLGSLPLMTDAERRRLIDGWNATDRPTDHLRPVHELFAEHVRNSPDAPALITGDECISYRELDHRAERLASLLKRLGVRPGLRVAICLESRADCITSLLAVLKLGAAYVPIDSAGLLERTRGILEDCEAALLISETDVAAGLGVTDCRVLLLDEEFSVTQSNGDAHRNGNGHSNGNGSSPDHRGGNGQSRDREGAVSATVHRPLPDGRGSQCAMDHRGLPESRVADLDAEAYVIYTSGSTGRPKGVSVTHRSLASTYHAWAETYPLADCRRHLQMANFAFDVCTGDVVRALCSGAALVLCPRETLADPERLYELIAREEIDAAEFVPAVLRLLTAHLELTGERLDGLRLLVAGSDAFYHRDAARLRKLCGPETRLVNSYGLTEATIDSSYHDATESRGAAEGLVPIGRPFPGTQMYVLDSRLEPVPVGVVGELHVAGAGLARGYVGRPQLTAERFLPNPFGPPGSRMYKTGDLARYRADGEVEYLGRTDHQIKVRGFRVELGEIEAVLARHPAVKELVVTASEELNRGTTLTVYAVARGGHELPPGALREFARGRLPDYMVPTRQVDLPALPRTASGKVNRAALPRPESDQPAALTEYVPPSTDTERQLAAIFEEVLGIERVGAWDDFFDLGGHSLLATQVLSRVRDRLGAGLPLRTLFMEPTVAGLARAVDEFDESEGTDTAGPIRRVTRSKSSNGAPNGAPNGSSIDEQTAADYLDRLDELSDDEVEALLAEMGEE